jgi:hypothetical protein
MIVINNVNKFAKTLLEAYFSAVNVEEGVLPPGFSSNDIETPEEYINSNTLGEEKEKPQQLLSPDDKGLSDLPSDTDMFQKKAEFGGKANHETPYIHRSTFTVVDDKGQKIDLDKLRDIITTRPKQILQQNSKIEKSGNKTYSFSNLTLPAYRGLYYDEKRKEFKIVTTCPSAGECKLICYARKGGYVMFPSAFTFSAKVLNFLLNDWQGFKNQLVGEIKELNEINKKKYITTVIRWHDSGDFFNEKYLQIALDIARETPEVIHYAYTKSVGMVSKADKPDNFVFNFSKMGKEDAAVKQSDKKSIIVPKAIFKDLFPQEGPHLNLKIDVTDEMLKTLQERISKTYKIPANTIITYKQLLRIPYDHRDTNIKPKWSVIVKPGDGDDAAMRKDVVNTLLFIH